MGILANPHPLTEAQSLVRIIISILHFQVSLPKEGSLIIVTAGGISRACSSARRCSFGGGVFDLIFDWHCFTSYVCRYEMIPGLG